MENEKSYLDNVLEKLDLKQFSPEKLSRNELYQITPESVDPDKSICTAAWQFIYNITRYNYQARNIKSNAHGSSTVSYRERMRRNRDQKRPFDHPLDIISAIFLCCDATARQDLTMHMWGCKLAVPLILQPEKSKMPSVYIWPLRSLIGQFEVENSLVEMPLINKQMKGIAMVRVGSNSQYSKSFLLNCLIGGPEKSHPIFFHRNSEGSKRNRSTIMDGLVEIGWFMTSDSNSNRFQGPRFFLNLRGDSALLEAQRQIIGQLATVTIVLSTVENIKSTKGTIEDLVNNGSGVILFFSDPEPDHDIILNFIENNFSDFSDSQFDVVTAEELMLSELLDILYNNINRLEASSKRYDCLANLVKTLSKEKCNVDENEKSYTRAFEITKDLICAVVQCNTDSDRKVKLMPLQEQFWKEWSEKDRDFYRYDQLDHTEREKYGSKIDLEKKLNDIRKDQFEHFSKYGLSDPLKYFVTAMSQLDDKSRKIFLRQTKLQLDNLSRKHLSPLYDQYQQLLNKTVDASEEERGQLNEELNKLDSLTTKLSFGLEHIMRELGQIYEACESQHEVNIPIVRSQERKINFTDLPKLAWLVLAEGYSIEILDGEACSVPLRWIKTVLLNLSSVLKDVPSLTSSHKPEVKVNIISILGIQSSGKSTFLNTVFGLQFAVSAGRCTRGAFLQLVKVHPALKQSIEADYILVIDTEGLKAAELISIDSHKHDNEFSTFVIGLADTTVINLMGENATYLHENLPIAVHAFLRMNMVGLNPKCTIVHHNVDKRNKEKLLQQGRILESVLNKQTQKACKLEKVPPKMFREIIEFSISRNTDYIPALFEGEQPMAPISIGYSKESDDMRAKLVAYIQDSHAYTLSIFVTRLENLWCAIKTDRFVYEFRTTLEAEAKLELDKGFSDILLEYIKQLDEIVMTLLPHVTSKVLTSEDVEKQYLDLISPVEDRCTREMQQFIERRKKINCFAKLKSEMSSSREKAKEMFKECYVDFETIPIEKIEKFHESLLNLTQDTGKTTYEYFDQEWTAWCISLNLLKRAETVLHDVTATLKQTCPSYKHLITDSLVEQQSIHKFQPLVETHLNHKFHNFTSEKISCLQSTMNRIKHLVRGKYEKELSEVKQRRMPYTDTVPKTIILNVERFLTGELQKINEGMEISHRFEIDLLVSLAGSIVCEFQGKLQSDFYLSGIKSHMRLAVVRKELQRDTEVAVQIIFDIVYAVILRNINGVIPTFFQDTLQNSKWKDRVLNKRALIGFCLVDMISTDNELLMKAYCLSPKYGVLKYLKYLLYLVVEDWLFVPALVNYIRSNLQHVLQPVYGLEKRLLQISDILDTMLENKKLDRLTEQILRYKSRSESHRTVGIYTLKKRLNELKETWIETITSKITNEIMENDICKDNISVCANMICKRLIGCTNVCPLCAEICIFTEGHPGEHECIIHRPVWCNDFVTGKPTFRTCTDHSALLNRFTHNNEETKVRSINTVHKDWKKVSPHRTESSKVWQWVYANKPFIIKELNAVHIPSEVKIKWNHNVDSVIDKIRELFNIYSIYNFKL